MRTVRIVFPLLCALVMVGAVVFGWLDDRPELSADDARDFAARALADIGLTDVQVAPEVAQSEYAPSSAAGEEPVPVWQTSSTTAEGTVELFVVREEGRAIFVRDAAADGTGGFLSDEQVTQLDDFRHDPPRDDRLLRNAVGTGAALLGVAVAVALSVVARRQPPPPVYYQPSPAW